MWIQPLLIVLIIINGTLSSSVDEFRTSYAVEYPLTSRVYSNNYCSHFSPEEPGIFFLKHAMCRKFVLGLFDGKMKHFMADIEEIMSECKRIYPASVDVKCALYLRHAMTFQWDSYDTKMLLSITEPHEPMVLNGNYILLDFTLPEEGIAFPSIGECLNVFAYADYNDVSTIISATEHDLENKLSNFCSCEEILFVYKIGIALFVKQEKIAGKEANTIDTAASTTAGFKFMNDVCNDTKQKPTDHWSLAQLLEILDTIEFEENFDVTPEALAHYLKNAITVVWFDWLNSDEESDHHWPFDYMYEKTHSMLSNTVAMDVIQKANELKMSPKTFDEFQALHLPDGSSLAALKSIQKSLEQFKDQLDSPRVCEIFKAENQLMNLKVFVSLFTEDAKNNAEEFAKNFDDDGLFFQFQTYIVSFRLSLDAVYSLVSLAQSRNIEPTLIVQCLNFFGKVQTRASELLTNQETEFVPNKYHLYDFGFTLFMKGPQSLIDLCSDGVNVRDVNDKNKLENLLKEVLSLDESNNFKPGHTVTDNLLSILA